MKKAKTDRKKRRKEEKEYSLFYPEEEGKRKEKEKWKAGGDTMKNNQKMEKYLAISSSASLHLAIMPVRALPVRFYPCPASLKGLGIYMYGVISRLLPVSAVR